MSQTFQQRVLTEFDRLTTEAGCQPVYAMDYANAGKMMAMQDWQTVATVYFMFSPGHNTLSFNGHFFDNIVSNGDRFLLSEDNHERIREMFDRWAELLPEPQPANSAGDLLNRYTLHQFSDCIGLDCDDCGQGILNVDRTEAVTLAVLVRAIEVHEYQIHGHAIEFVVPPF